MKPISITQAFNQLIKKRAWYKDSKIDRKKAYQEKMNFLDGKLSEDKIREYLQNAGYEFYKPELWIKK